MNYLDFARQFLADYDRGQPGRGATQTYARESDVKAVLPNYDTNDRNDKRSKEAIDDLNDQTDQSPRVRAERFLVELLANGRVPLQEILAEANARRIGPAALQAAKRSLGVLVVKNGHEGREWQLLAKFKVTRLKADGTSTTAYYEGPASSRRKRMDMRMRGAPLHRTLTP